MIKLIKKFLYNWITKIEQNANAKVPKYLGGK